MLWLSIIFKCQFVDLPFKSQIKKISTHLKNLKMGIVKWPLKQLCDEKDIRICSYINYWEVLHNLAQNASTKCITCTCCVHYLHFETAHYAFKLLHMPPKIILQQFAQIWWPLLNQTKPWGNNMVVMYGGIL